MNFESEISRIVCRNNNNSNDNNKTNNNKIN